MIIIDHNEEVVPLGGKGLELLWSAPADVSEKKIKILPLCPFAKASFQKYTEWKDLW
ncbi:MAG: putative GNAT family acetyltransferase [Roseivirga sp.]